MRAYTSKYRQQQGCNFRLRLENQRILLTGSKSENKLHGFDACQKMYVFCIDLILLALMRGEKLIDRLPMTSYIAGPVVPFVSDGESQIIPTPCI